MESIDYSSPIISVNICGNEHTVHKCIVEKYLIGPGPYYIELPAEMATLPFTSHIVLCLYNNAVTSMNVLKSSPSDALLYQFYIKYCRQDCIECKTKRLLECTELKKDYVSLIFSNAEVPYDYRPFITACYEKVCKLLLFDSSKNVEGKFLRALIWDALYANKVDAFDIFCQTMGISPDEKDLYFVPELLPRRREDLIRRN